ncbi:hypothetical protein CPB84DRAFT_1803579 [Gymnopilus junonius]|uniref:Secreted protein n=1 Tax=Gymnopilus junonius TaxID=109634 RepID=A0A9P5N9C8_GYMJU|nr:hypothetical protein CPB84DRAFT_1803579 [Gymnopilus junonius]
MRLGCVITTDQRPICLILSFLGLVLEIEVAAEGFFPTMEEQKKKKDHFSKHDYPRTGARDFVTSPEGYFLLHSCSGGVTP